MSAQGYVGAGDVQFSPIVSGVEQGYGDLRQAVKFEIKPNSDIKELESRGRATYGQVVETVAVQRPADISITLSQADYENLKLAFMGSDGGNINQAAATVSDENVTIKKGRWVALANRNLQAAGLVLTNSAGTTTYVLGTDYEVNYRLGEIRALESGAIADGAVCKVDYQANAISGQKILGATSPSVRAKVRFDGQNLADNSPMLIECWEAVFTPDSAFDALADDFGQVELKGRLKTPVGKQSPFTVEFPLFA